MDVREEENSVVDASNLFGVNGEIRLDVSVEGGKYRYVMWDGGSHVYRYDEPWQDALANKMLYCFAAEVADLRKQLAEARAALKKIADEPEVHTKLNQERLCCKFQDIATRALGATS
jgi:hypothetical protein